jgi:protein-disulfide isomerase
VFGSPRQRLLGCLTLLPVLAVAAAACSPAAATAPSPASVDPVAGITVGEGEVDIQLWSDPSCPHCMTLDDAIGDELADVIANGTATWTLHPMTYVSAKRGDTTDYSTRAAALLFGVAAAGDADAVLPLYELIQQNQVSAEGAPTDADLVGFAAAAGSSSDLSTAITDYAAIATAANEAWLGAAIPGTDQVVDHVPLLVIDGTVFEVREDGTDAARFRAAVTDATAD